VGHVRLVTLLLQKDRQQFGVVGIVIDDEHFARRPRLC
jgi:hypothetical protein